MKSRVNTDLGRAGCQPAFVGSLPSIAGKLPALPEPKKRAIDS
jgi:hypothetical protein